MNEEGGPRSIKFFIKIFIKINSNVMKTQFSHAMNPAVNTE